MKTMLTEKLKVTAEDLDFTVNDFDRHKNVSPIDHKDLSVTTAKIAGGAVTNAKIANDAVTTDKIATQAIENVKLKRNDSQGQGGAVDGNVVRYGSLRGDTHLQGNSITGSQIKPGEIEERHLKSGDTTAAVFQNQIRNGAILARHIVNGQVTNEKIGGGAVHAGNLNQTPGSEAVTTNTIRDNSVNAAKLANNAVTDDKIGRRLLQDQSASDELMSTIHSLGENHTTWLQKARNNLKWLFNNIVPLKGTIVPIPRLLFVLTTSTAAYNTCSILLKVGERANPIRFAEIIFHNSNLDTFYINDSVGDLLTEFYIKVREGGQLGQNTTIEIGITGTSTNELDVVAFSNPDNTWSFHNLINENRTTFRDGTAIDSGVRMFSRARFVDSHHLSAVATGSNFGHVGFAGKIKDLEGMTVQYLRNRINNFNWNTNLLDNGFTRALLPTTNGPVATGAGADSAVTLITATENARATQTMFHNNGNIYHRAVQDTVYTPWETIATQNWVRENQSELDHTDGFAALGITNMNDVTIEDVLNRLSSDQYIPANKHTKLVFNMTSTALCSRFKVPTVPFNTEGNNGVMIIERGRPNTPNHSAILTYYNSMQSSSWNIWTAVIGLNQPFDTTNNQFPSTRWEPMVKQNVRFDIEQNLTNNQKIRSCTNINALRKIIETSCISDAETPAKVVTINETGGDGERAYVLTAGDMFFIKYTSGNTADNHTISINGSGAIPVRLGGIAPTGTFAANVAAGGSLMYYYNGEYMQQLGASSINEPPHDGKLYGMRNGQWVAI